MERAIDLVCGMEVDPKNAPFQSNYEGRTHYFCSAECKRRFDLHPQIYIQNNAEALRSDGEKVR